jgi:hypothetical protein
MIVQTSAGLTNTTTGEIIDLTPLRHKPRYKATRRRVSNQSHQDDTMFMLAALTALLAAIAIVA